MPSFSSLKFKSSSKFLKVSSTSFCISLLTSFERQERPYRMTQLGASPVWVCNQSQNLFKGWLCGLSAAYRLSKGRLLQLLLLQLLSEEAITSSSNVDAVDAFGTAQEKQLGLIKKGNATIFAITSVP